MPEDNEALRSADETRFCSTCNRRTWHHVVNYKTKDDMSCKVCGTSTTIRYEKKTEKDRTVRPPKREYKDKKLGRPKKKDEEE